MLYGQDRRALRQVYFRAWRKHSTGEPLEGAEQLIVTVALRHPEYHALLARPEAGEDRDWLPELGEANPFLHLGLHIAIEEQLAIDQPPGIRLQYARLCRQYGDEHAAQHWMMECLGEMMWQAGRENRPPDMQAYLDCLARDRTDVQKNR
jgi:hypothetical protein